MFKSIVSVLFMLSCVMAVSSCSKENVVRESNKITIKFESGKGGTIDLSGSQTGDEGSTLYSVAKAGGGYFFAGWYDGDNLLDKSDDIIVSGSKLEVKLTQHTANKIYTAKFADESYMVKIEKISSIGGSVGPDSCSAAVDGRLIFTATPESDYMVVWYDYKRVPIISTDESLPFYLSTDGLKLFVKSSKEVDGKTFKVAFTKGNLYVVNFQAFPTDGGSVTPTDSIAAEDVDITSVATAFDNYEFEGWYTQEGDKIDAISGDIYVDGTTLHVKSTSSVNTKNFIANFKKKEYVVNFNAEDSNGGTVTESSGSGFMGDVLSSDIETVAVGYEFLGWYDGDNQIIEVSDEAAAYLSNNNRQLNVKVSGDKNYTARFQLVNSAVQEPSETAPRIDVIGLGDEAKLILTGNHKRYGVMFQFGSIIAWDKSNDVTASNVLFSPLEVAISGWNSSWAVGNSFPDNSLANLKEGKGDPCCLIGFSQKYIKEELNSGRTPDNGAWRLPTKDEHDSLYSKYSDWTSLDGTNGRYFGPDAVSAGKGEFIPAAGYRSNAKGEYVYKDGYGAYWSSTPIDSSNGYYLGFNKEYV
ncbi:MAG: InlB B-repeat-containing protein, partial [Phocaeicola sp.]